MPHFTNKSQYGHYLNHSLAKKDGPIEGQMKKPRRVFDILKIEKIGHQYLP
jgi:hypothetical protein